MNTGDILFLGGYAHNRVTASDSRWAGLKIRLQVCPLRHKNAHLFYPSKKVVEGMTNEEGPGSANPNGEGKRRGTRVEEPRNPESRIKSSPSDLII